MIQYNRVRSEIMRLFKNHNNKSSDKVFAVCGIVEIDNKILFVRHTYGVAKDRILLPVS